MAVLSGLVKKADSVDMIAGVLAHELMHVRHRHGMRHIVRAAGVITALTVLAGDATGLFGLAAEGAALAALTSYSREMESEADLDGLRLAAAAGFDPAGMPAFFRKLAEIAPDSQAPEALSWMASHPRHDERIAVLEAAIPGLVRAESTPMKHTLEAARAALKGD
jgi:predicted Zn-dependent protease